ncbi:MAG: archease [Planctomycetaceae bacterium]
MPGRASTFDHDADVGVRGEGATLAEAFCGAARAMFSVMLDLGGVRGTTEVPISCEAPDPELLLVAWLNALLAEADLRGMVFCDFRAEIVGERLFGSALGERFDPARHVRGVEVKGATLTELAVARVGEGWFVQTVVDV